MAEIDKVTEEHCVTYPDLLKDGKSVIKKFRTLMQFFRKCHQGYNSATYMSDSDIDQLGKC